MERVFWAKGNMYCLAMGHIKQRNDCFEDKWTRIGSMPLIFTKGTCPSLLCRRRSTLFVLGKIECEAEHWVLLQLGVFTSEQEWVWACESFRWMNVRMQTIYITWSRQSSARSQRSRIWSKLKSLDSYSKGDIIHLWSYQTLKASSLKGPGEDTKNQRIQLSF